MIMLRYAEEMGECGDEERAKARDVRDVLDAVVEAELNEVFLVQIARWERVLRRRIMRV